MLNLVWSAKVLWLNRDGLYKMTSFVIVSLFQYLLNESDDLCYIDGGYFFGVWEGLFWVWE